MRNYVRARRHAMGLLRHETFVPQSYALGVEAPFHWAYLHATQQAFMEAHEHAFEYFG